VRTESSNHGHSINWLFLLFLILLSVSCSSTGLPGVETQPISQEGATTLTPGDEYGASPTISGTTTLMETTRTPAVMHATRSIPSHTPVPWNAPAPPLETAAEAVSVVKSHYPNVADITDTPDNVIDKSDDIYVLPRVDGWRLVFWRGWGDCPAGCINAHYWYFFVKTDGEIELVGEYERVYEPGLNRYRETGQRLWGIPW
jgi:hypothetical protein